MSVVATLALVAGFGARTVAARALSVPPRASHPSRAVRDVSEASPAPRELSAPTNPPLARPPPSAEPRRPRRARPSRETDPLRWVELRPRLFERSDGRLRADLRGIADLAPFSRGLRARVAREGGFELTAFDAQGYLRAAGIAPGDRLVAINGRPTRSLDELLAAYALARFGATLSLQFARGTTSYLLLVELVRDGG